MNHRSLYFVIGMLIFLVALPLTVVGAQDADHLELRLFRSFGFQSGVQIQGSFSARVSGPDSLIKVALYLDDQNLGADDETPFRFSFSTADFAPGEHRLWAMGTTETGKTLRSDEKRLIFLTAEQGWSKAGNYLKPIFLLIGAVSVLSVIWAIRPGKRDRFRLGEYGSAGGAVCRRCGMPFARHFIAPNLVLGKLERCPHCSRWEVVPKASAAALEEAEARFLADAEQGSYQQAKIDSEAERLQRIEDSRFES